jgi:hypothetical protein
MAGGPDQTRVSAAANAHTMMSAGKGKRRRERLLEEPRELIIFAPWILVSTRMTVNRHPGPCPDRGSCHHLVVPQCSGGVADDGAVWRFIA